MSKFGEIGVSKKEKMAGELAKKLDSVMTPAELRKKGRSVQYLETKEDYKESRNMYKRLLAMSEESLQTLMIMAQDTEHPRAYEVLSNMIKSTADITDKYIELQLKMRKLEEMDNELSGEGKKQPALEGKNVTNNNVFVGSTAELQKMIRANMMTIDQDDSTTK